MSKTDPAALVRRVFHEGTAQPNSREVLDEIFAPNFACHGPPGMEHSHAGGAEGIERCIFNDAFTDLRFEIQEITVQADTVTAHFTARGRQIAEFMGVPPRAQEARAQGVATFRIEGDQVAEGWGSLNWA